MEETFLRLFGKQIPAKNNDDEKIKNTIKQFGSRINDEKLKVAKIENDLNKLKIERKSTKSKQSIKLIESRMKNLLKKKSMIEGNISRLDNMLNQLDYIKYNVDNLEISKAFNNCAVDMKNQFKNLPDIDQVDDTMADLKENLEHIEEINFQLTEQFNIGPNIDEDDLLDEFLNDDDNDSPDPLDEMNNLEIPNHPIIETKSNEIEEKPMKNKIKDAEFYNKLYGV